MAFYYIWYDIQVGAPEMVIFFISFLFCVNPSRILSGKRAWELRKMGTTISRMMNAILIAPLARYLYQGRDRGYQESLKPPAKNTSAPQTYSTFYMLYQLQWPKPKPWFWSLTNQLKKLFPHSWCLNSYSLQSMKQPPIT